MKKNIDEKYKNLKSEFESFPANDIKSNPKSYIDALNTMKPGDIASIFTPDDTHFEIAMATLERGLHLLCTKPLVKTLKEHKLLV